MIPLLLSLGALFFLALGAGRLCSRLRIPRVTGYLVVGLLAGPSLAEIVGIPALLDHHQLEEFTPLHDLTIGLIVLVIGGNFHVKTMRKFGPRILATSVSEMGVTALLVGGLAYLAGAGPLAAAFLSLMAVTTAPAATQMVVREYEAEGPLTDTVMTLIGLDNFAAIIAFVLLAHGVVTPEASFYLCLIKIFGPMGLGFGAGIVMALMDQRITRQVERQILALATVGALVGLCEHLDLSAMLATLVAGAVLVNTSPHERRILSDLSVVDYPLYVIFFVMAGAHLHLSHLVIMGPVGAAYILGRVGGKLLGCNLGARAINVGGAVRRWLGPGMMAQAGLAIGLSAVLAKDWGADGRQVQTVVLASVVVFEGLGPLITRMALVRAGEVTILNMLFQRSPVGYGEGLHEVVNHFRDLLGLSEAKTLTKPSDILVSHVMRKNVETIAADVPFDGILKTLGQLALRPPARGGQGRAARGRHPVPGRVGGPVRSHAAQPHRRRGHRQPRALPAHPHGQPGEGHGRAPGAPGPHLPAGGGEHGSDQARGGCPPQRRPVGAAPDQGLAPLHLGQLRRGSPPCRVLGRQGQRL